MDAARRHAYLAWQVSVCQMFHCRFLIIPCYEALAVCSYPENWLESVMDDCKRVVCDLSGFETGASFRQEEQLLPEIYPIALWRLCDSFDSAVVISDRWCETAYFCETAGERVECDDLEIFGNCIDGVSAVRLTYIYVLAFEILYVCDIGRICTLSKGNTPGSFS